jgi:SAM-dependent methyltransferase
MTNPVDFSFGKNWLEFLRGFDEERLHIAESSLLDFMGLESLEGKSFIDIGCGSGLFSYAAFGLGASRVVSFDVDQLCVRCCIALRERAGNPAQWEVLHGSVLDDAFLSRLGSFDIVYSWGVLHHTGRMWDAVEKSLRLVRTGGYYYIALYNKILRRDGKPAWVHSFWTTVKKLHNTHPFFGSYVLQPPALAAYLGIVMLRGENPVAHVKNYKSHRGMSWRTDATDWLGGYPYEYATVEEVFAFVRSRNLDFNLANIKVTSGRGLNWFLFVRDKRPDSP